MELLTRWSQDKMAAIFADNILKCIFLNENVWISIKNPFKFVPKGPINNIPALVQIMAWCRPGDKPLSEPMLVSAMQPHWVNSLAPGKFEWNFMYTIFKLISVRDVSGISCRIVLIWMPLGFTGDQSTLVKVMAWCCQATSHYVSQCWSRSLSPYDVTRPQWVKKIVLPFPKMFATASYRRYNQCKTVLSPVHQHWRYHSFALSLQYYLSKTGLRGIPVSLVPTCCTIDF